MADSKGNADNVPKPLLVALKHSIDVTVSLIGNVF